MFNGAVRAEGVKDGGLFVTGSRLDQSASLTPAPVTKIDGAEIRALGYTRLEDLLNTLPQAFAAQTTRVSNGATGTSQINLRGLGSERTLVLVDGKRLPYGSPSSIATNLDIVPAQLVERIDVVTGGASAVYGSDAIAGVVNFIMRRDFEGIEFDGQVGVYQDGNGNDFANALLGANGIIAPGAKLDGRSTLVSILFGANSADGRGNVTAFLSYQDQNAIRADARDYSACNYANSVASPSSVGGIGCVGSSSFRRFFTPGGSLFLSDDGTFVPFTGAPDQTFNFASANFIQRPLQRFNFSTFARYEITDDVEVYLDLSFMDNVTTAQLAPSATFFRPFSVNCDNPFLTAPVSTGNVLRDSLGCSAADVATGVNVPLSASYRNVEGDPRQTIIGNTTYRLVGGLRGDFGNHWQWDAYGQFTKVDERKQFRNDLNIENVQDALFAVSDGVGGAVCRSGNANCAPYNIFQRPGGQSQVSQAAVDYIQGVSFTNGNTEQKIIGATLRGDLGVYGFQFPLATNGIQLLGGVEWREDTLNSQPDDLSQAPIGRSFTGVSGGIQPVEGEVRVTELFTEMQIPLIEGKPFFQQLSINGAYRYSDYSFEGNGFESSFDAHSFGGGVSWSPLRDIHFRGQFQRAMRAPNVVELFSGPGAFTVDDFTLNPEKSDTYSAGVVLTPRVVPGLSITADYFDIAVNDVIGEISVPSLLNQCISLGNPLFCNLITRDSSGRLFISFSSLAVNTPQQLSTRGVSINGKYYSDIGSWGAINFTYDASILFELSTNPIPTITAAIECKDLYAGQCGDPNSTFRHRMVTTWQTPWNVDLTATWRYRGGVDFDSGIPSVSTGGTALPSGNVLNDRLDPANYLDLGAQWYVRENTTLRAGIQNVLGRDPDLTIFGGGFTNGNTFPNTYDPFGRFVYFGVTLRN